MQPETAPQGAELPAPRGPGAQEPGAGTTRLILLCHASTTATRRSAFPADEPLDEVGVAACARATLPRTDAAWCSPALRARHTAHALGLDPTSHPALDECDYGRWRGRSLDDVAATEPAALSAWLTDPAATPHGGESVSELIARVDGWMSTSAVRRGRAIAVTHASVIRAAVIVALDAPAHAFWRIDVAPLSQTVLHARDGRWTVRATGVPSA